MKNSLLLIFIFSIISYSKQFDSNNLEINIQNIFYINKEMEIENNDYYKNEYYYHLIIDKNLDLPNYLLITLNVEGVNKFSILFYQDDSTFTKIKQASSAAHPLSSSNPKIWLNKEQIKKGFYFKIKDDYQKFIFKVKIIPKDNCELTLDEDNSLYDYYITPENKNMNFIIKGEKEINYINNNTIIIWINSNKEIKVDLNKTDYIKHSKYNAFIIRQKNYEEYKLNIKGTVGDFINIGFIYIKTENNYNIVQNKLKINIGDIYKGFLKKNFLEQICFNEDDNINYKLQRSQYFPLPTVFNTRGNYKFIDNINIDINSIFYRGVGFLCTNLPENYDELVFDVHYLWHSLRVYPPNYYSLLTGINYYQSISERTTLGYLPKDINNNSDFNFLTYHIISYMSKDVIFKVYISECNEYPSCPIEKIDLKNSIEIKPYFNSYTYILKKKDLKKYLNPINNKKKILIIDCIKGDDKACKFNINIYTDKIKVIQKLHKYNFFLYKFINDKNNDNLLIFPVDLHDFFYGYRYPIISIELLSGDITIKADKKIYINYENKYIFKLNSLNEALDIKIKAKQNSIYCIKYYYIIKDYNNYYAPLGENYLFSIEKESKLFFYEYNNNKNYIFTRIYPINCGTDSLLISDLNMYELPNSNRALYQSIKPYETEFNIKNSNHVNSCMIYCFSYKKESEIILYDNSPQFFAFNKDIKELNYIYYLGDIHKDIYINISLLNKGNYNINLYINDIEYEKYFNITSNKIIIIDHIQFENISINYYPIKISIKIKLNDNFENSMIKININLNSKLFEKNNNNTENNFINNSDDTINIKKIYIFIFILFLVSGLILNFLFKKIKIYCFRNKNDDSNIEMKEIDSKFIE